MDLNNQKQMVTAAKANVNKPKSELISIRDSLESISPKNAKILTAIIQKLERWQNSK